MRFIASVLVTLAMTACATARVGADFDGSKLARLERGKTTLPQASVLLGRTPDQTQVGASGALAHTWRFIESKAGLGSAAAKTKQAMLVFNNDGTFQRILSLSGIDLTPEDRQRLFASGKDDGARFPTK